MKALSKDALLVASRQELIDSIVSLYELTEKLQNKIQEQQVELDFFKRQIFGARSERFIPDASLQTTLELGDKPQSTPAPATTQQVSYTRTVSSETNKPKGHGRGTMPSHLRIEKKVIQPEGNVEGMVCIGTQTSWYFEMERNPVYIVLIERPKYVPADGNGVLIADLPPLPIDKGNAGPGLMARVTIDKYVNHLPLDRQRKMFNSESQVEFSLSWLADLVKSVGFWIEPVYIAYVNLLKACGYIQADETPIPVLTRDHRGRTHRGYFWVYHAPLERLVVFDYRESRSARGPTEFLAGFQGTLQVDGYEGYNQVMSRPGIAHAGCMDHVRRRFEQSLDYDRTRAQHALEQMQPWYALEAAARKDGLTLEERFARRVEQTVPSMKQFKAWLDAEVTVVLPKSPMGGAICYALNQWPYFTPFMSDARVELSNILVENAIRPVAIGRKNYLFSGSHDAARRAAMIYTLVSIAKLHKVDPFDYIKHLLTKLPAAKNKDVGQFLLPACTL